MLHHYLAPAGKRRLALILALGAAAGSAFAQAQPAGPVQPGTPIVSSPEVRQQNGVSYVTGGVGDTGQARVKELGKDMNLQLVFAQASGGNFLADVAVSIADNSGKKLLDVKSSDPLLFAQLPPGNYKVTATAKGKSIERNVNVAAKGQHTETLHW